MLQISYLVKVYRRGAPSGTPDCAPGCSHARPNGGQDDADAVSPAAGANLGNVVMDETDVLRSQCGLGALG